MNALDFINSRDVRAHLEKIGWQPDSLCAAWLIYQSKNHTLEEKLLAWQSVIDNMPDCAVPENYSGTYHESLHTFLKRYIELQHKLVNSFKKCNTGEVYSYKYYGKNCDGFLSDGGLYSSYEKVMEAMNEEICEEYKPYVFRLTKRRIDSPELDVHAELSPGLEIRSIVDMTAMMLGEDDEGDIEVLFRVFEGMWFDIPTPFCRGDLVRECGGKYHVPSNYRQETLVFDSMTANNENSPLAQEKEDMNAYGYFPDGDGGVYYGCAFNYISLEFITPNQLTPQEAILTSLPVFINKM